ncbi:MAG: transposase [Candidatus Eremiobacteraeota bacterium]|nr:transposase [Candidatus Eremiobacteraeota bacterium]
MTAKIRDYEKQIEILAKDTYPVTGLLCQVNGVGALTGLAYVLTIGDPYRFKKSRILGSYFDLRPRRDDSGERKTQMRIAKAGNSYMRRLLVSSANYILGPFGKDCDLRRWGLHMVQRGGKAAKKRAIIAVARKLSVLLHRLWVTGEVYEPFRQKAQGKGE